MILPVTRETRLLHFRRTLMLSSLFDRRPSYASAHGWSYGSGRSHCIGYTAYGLWFKGYLPFKISYSNTTDVPDTFGDLNVELPLLLETPRRTNMTTSATRKARRSNIRSRRTLLYPRKGSKRVGTIQDSAGLEGIRNLIDINTYLVLNKQEDLTGSSYNPNPEIL